MFAHLSRQGTHLLDLGTSARPQRHQDGGSSRSRAEGVRLRIAASRARVRRAGGLVMRRLAGRAAVLAGLPVLIAGLAAGTAAAAAGGGQVSNYTGTGISAPFAITAGPDGALWFTNQNGVPGSTGGTIGKITTSGTVTNYGNSLIDDPAGITAWNGALWFTNSANGTGGSIVEMTTSGVLTNDYTGNGIDGPEGITVGPDGGCGSPTSATARSARSPSPPGPPGR
jgi:streptogramin lyase